MGGYAVSLSFVVQSSRAERRRRPAIVLAALVGVLCLVSLLVRATAAWADDHPLSYISSPAAGARGEMPR